MSRSIEPNIVDLGNSWLKKYNLDYKLEQEPLNAEIDKALADYFTKNGGTGANRPDVKLLLQDKRLNFYPILIEYKGQKDRLVKLDEQEQVENRTKQNKPHFRNINNYAVNGAVHYANAILHYTSYKKQVPGTHAIWKQFRIELELCEDLCTLLFKFLKRNPLKIMCLCKKQT